MVEKSNLALSDGRFDYYTNEIPFDHQHAGSRTMPVLNKFESQNFCAGCGIRILDRYYLLAVDKQWHVTCLKCSDCKIQLDSELTCFARGGSIYCKDDYYRRFGVKRCARCHQGIAANELVMKARELVYHINCFTCSSCHKALSTGDQFGMKENLVYCRTDYEMLFQGEYFQSLSDELSCHPEGHLPFYNGVGTVQKGRPRKRKTHLPDGDVCPPGMGLVPGDGDRGGDMMRQDGYCSQQPPRQKRVRTSFKHHQLRTMKSYFNLNHNPDAKDLKQLSQKTGLSKRVLQVWFQNARAKHRRNQMKSDGDKPDKADNQTSSDNIDDDKHKDSLSMSEITDSQSPIMSDISSSPSLSELHSGHVESDHSTSSLSDLFTNSINSIN